MKTCSEKALEWNVTPRTVNAMCKNGRIQGAVKISQTSGKISGYFLNLQRCKIRYVGSNHRQNPRITSGRIWEASGITEQ